MGRGDGRRNANTYIELWRWAEYHRTDDRKWRREGDILFFLRQVSHARWMRLFLFLSSGPKSLSSCISSSEDMVVVVEEREGLRGLFGTGR